jgi:hypothetical protein
MIDYGQGAGFPVVRIVGGCLGRTPVGAQAGPQPLLAAGARPRTPAGEGEVCLRRWPAVESII